MNKLKRYMHHTIMKVLMQISKNPSTPAYVLPKDLLNLAF